MSQRIVLVVGLACILALGSAIWVFAAGYGLFAAIATYAFGGSALVVSIAGVAAVIGSEEFDADMVTPVAAVS